MVPGSAPAERSAAPDTDLGGDMGSCHTYYFEYDVRTHAPAHYWEGPNLFPTPIPPPPPPANPPNIFEQCAGQIPFVTCLPGLQPSPPSVELRWLGAGALEFVEVRIGGEDHRCVPQLAGLFPARDLGQHGPEERHPVDVDGGRTDVIADGVHAGVVALRSASS